MRTIPVRTSKHLYISVFAPLGAGMLMLATGRACVARGWEAAPALPVARVYPVGIAQGNTVLALGGTPLDANGDAPAHRLTLGGTWQPIAPMDGGVIGQGGGIDALGRIIVFGGYDASNGDVGKAYQYDPIDGGIGNVAARPPQSSPAGFAWATDDQSRLYCIGGRPRTGTQNLSRCDRYDAATDSWVTLTPMNTPVHDGCATSDGLGHVLVFGGFDAAGTSRVANVARYDVATDSWSDTAVPDMPGALSGARAVLGSDNRVYVIGGQDASGTVVSTVWVLSLATNMWSLGESMSTPRMHFAAARGSDDRVYVIGGENGVDGLTSCERLYTPPCPSVAPPPSPVVAWQGGPASFTMMVTGGQPLVLHWERDGVPLSDGPTGTGSTIVGSATQTLTVQAIGPSDLGSYVLVAANDCGTVASPGVLITLRTPRAVPSSWVCTSIHHGVYSSGATGVFGDTVLGWYQSPDARYPQLLYLDKAAAWLSGSSVPVDITPPSSVQAKVNCASGGVAGGYWFKPYSTPHGTAYYMRPCLWYFLPPILYADLNYAGGEYGMVRGTDGVRAVGYAYSSFGDPGISSAQGWDVGTGNLQYFPSGSSYSIAGAVEGSSVFGEVDGHAGLLISTNNWVDMHPGAPFTSSGISGAGDGQQVGTVSAPGVSHPALWTGSAGSCVDLAPPGGLGGTAAVCKGGWQVGSLGSHATIWTGNASTAFDLHQFAPPGFTSTSATALDFLPDGRVIVVGFGLKSPPNAHYEALKWVFTPPPACIGDFDHDAQRNTADLTLMLGSFGQMVPPGSAGDINGDGLVNTLDLTAFLGVFGVMCP